MSTIVAVFEEDGQHPHGRLVAASAAPEVVGAVARLLLTAIPASSSPIIAELDAGRRRALRMIIDLADFLSDTGAAHAG